MTDKYFATLPGQELAEVLSQGHLEYNEAMDKNGLRAMMRKTYSMYYGKHFKTGFAEGLGIKAVGDSGELKALTINLFRSVIKRVFILATSQKPAWDPRAVNTDPESLQQTQLAGPILDYYMREKRLSRQYKKAAEYSLVFGKGFIKTTWDRDAGRAYTVKQATNNKGEPVLDETGQPKMQPVYEGDVKVKAYSPLDYRVDQNLQDWTERSWEEFRDFENKYTLAARYPELADNILALSNSDELSSIAYSNFQNIDQTDLIPVFEWYHKRDDALPNGRVLIFSDPDTIYYDGPIPYKKLPGRRIVPGEIFGTAEGYTDAFDLVDAQEGLNVMMSTAFTNLQAFATQFLYLPEGCNLTSHQMSGLAIAKGGTPGSEPKAIQMASIPGELFKFNDLMEKYIQTLSGMNAAAMGNPGEDLKSGKAIAYVQAMAMQYISGFQESYAELLEDGGTDVIHLLRDFAKTERMFAIAGKNNRSSMKSFTGDQLKNIDRVIVDLGNPAQKTIAGKMSTAEDFLEKGFIKTPQDYMTVVQTGSLEVVTDPQKFQQDLAASENSDMMDGKQVRALVTDAHLYHGQHHRTLLDDCDLRRRAAAGEPMAQEIVANIMAHLQEHEQLKMTQTPMMAAISGEPPMGPPPGAMPPPGPQGPGPQGPPPPEAQPPGPQGPGAPSTGAPELQPPPPPMTA